MSKTKDQQSSTKINQNVDENIEKLNINDEDEDDEQKPIESSSNGGDANSNNNNNKEEIRRRLAFEIDDDPIAQYKLNVHKSKKKSQSLLSSSRIQNLDSLQICFLNENNTDNNDDYIFGDLNQIGNETNNNDIIMQNRIYYLFKKLQKVNFDLDKVDLFVDIEKPNDQLKFSEYHSKLYTEAKLTLSQIKEICKLRLKIDKENEKEISSIYDLIHNFPPDFQKGITKLTIPILRRLRMSELQLIVNDHFSRIEKLNTSLVKLLITRDELYMEQDSLLVDIEDLTKFLLSK
ncbi:schwannomin interacting protein 1 [Dermatophagoides pteronyssinus]|uniref:Schwannomin-interacting protein 1-like n=1 Tax=Dermatophagoides pteronyssinus TaxID=6956 RepID=A0A6P6XSA2_DERPT|nr:schwannomin-interacting protein 1-like [Dermatophagoides pteronyssinus]